MQRAAIFTASLSFSLFVLGCSADSTLAAPSSPADAGAGTSNDAGPSPTTPDPACLAVEADLQERVDDARSGKKWAHAAVAVKTPRCGTIVVTSDDPTKPDKALPESLWRIGSVTKTFVAAAMLNVAASGRLDIDDALAKTMPDYPNAANITLRQLLNHTSGVPDFFHVVALVRAMEKDRSRAVTADEVLDFVKAEPPEFEPGKKWSYSNTNYVLLGRVLESVTGEPLVKVLRANAIERAGLTHTFFDGAEPMSGDLVSGYEDGVEWTHKLHPSWYGAAGAIAATPADLVEWTDKLYGSDAVIDQTMRREMLATIPTNASRIKYGLGVMERSAADTKGNGVAFGHSGGVFGYRAQIFYFPESKIAMAAMIADSDGDPVPLCDGALEAVQIVK